MYIANILHVIPNMPRYGLRKLSPMLTRKFWQREGTCVEFLFPTLHG